MGSVRGWSCHTCGKYHSLHWGPQVQSASGWHRISWSGVCPARPPLAGFQHLLHLPHPGGPIALHLIQPIRRDGSSWETLVAALPAGDAVVWVGGGGGVLGRQPAADADWWATGPSQFLLRRLGGRESARSGVSGWRLCHCGVLLSAGGRQLWTCHHTWGPEGAGGHLRGSCGLELREGGLGLLQEVCGGVRGSAAVQGGHGPECCAVQWHNPWGSETAKKNVNGKEPVETTTPLLTQSTVWQDMSRPLYSGCKQDTVACERAWSELASWTLHSAIAKKRNRQSGVSVAARWDSPGGCGGPSGNRDTSYGGRMKINHRQAVGNGAAPPNSWQHVDWGSKRSVIGVALFLWLVGCFFWPSVCVCVVCVHASVCLSDILTSASPVFTVSSLSFSLTLSLCACLFFPPYLSFPLPPPPPPTPPTFYWVIYPGKYIYISQTWESSDFCWNSGFLMVPEVILEISLNLQRKLVCVYDCTL